MRAWVITAAVAVLSCAATARADDTTDAHELPPQEAPRASKPHGLVVPVTVLGGIRVGGAVDAGLFASDTIGVNDVRAGVDLGLEIGAIVLDHIYGGFTFGGTLFVSPESTSKSVSSLLIGAEFGWLTSTTRVGGLFALGLGYRALYVSDAVGNANKFDCPDALFTVALHLPAGSFVRLLPRVDFAVGTVDGSNVHAIFTVGLSVWLGGQVYPSKPKH